MELPERTRQCGHSTDGSLTVFTDGKRIRLSKTQAPVVVADASRGEQKQTRNDAGASELNAVSAAAQASQVNGLTEQLQQLPSPSAASSPSKQGDQEQQQTRGEGIQSAVDGGKEMATVTAYVEVPVRRVSQVAANNAAVRPAATSEPSTIPGNRDVSLAAATAETFTTPSDVQPTATALPAPPAPTALPSQLVAAIQNSPQIELSHRQSTSANHAANRMPMPGTTATYMIVNHATDASSATSLLQAWPQMSSDEGSRAAAAAAAYARHRSISLPSRSSPTPPTVLVQSDKQLRSMLALATTPEPQFASIDVAMQHGMAWDTSASPLGNASSAASPNSRVGPTGRLKRPRNAFILWQQNFAQLPSEEKDRVIALANANANNPSHHHLARLAEVWKALPAEERLPFEEAAVGEQNLFRETMTALAAEGKVDERGPMRKAHGNAKKRRGSKNVGTPVYDHEYEAMSPSLGSRRESADLDDILTATPPTFTSMLPGLDRTGSPSTLSDVRLMPPPRSAKAVASPRGSKKRRSSGILTGLGVDADANKSPSGAQANFPARAGVVRASSYSSALNRAMGTGAWPSQAAHETTGESTVCSVSATQAALRAASVLSSGEWRFCCALVCVANAFSTQPCRLLTPSPAPPALESGSTSSPCPRSSRRGIARSYRKSLPRPTAKWTTSFSWPIRPSVAVLGLCPTTMAEQTISKP